MVSPVPLQAEDLRILALESDRVAGHTCKVVLLGPEAPDVEALRESIAGRLGAAPGLTRRLGGAAHGLAWVPDDDFDVRAHVGPAPVERPLDATALRGAVARLFAQRLDRGRPLWRIDVLPLADGGRALVWRLHHALADGTAAMRYARAILWDPLPDAPSDPKPRSGHRDDDARRRAHLAAFVRREVALGSGRSPFDGPLGTRREVAFARAPLRALHDAAKRLAGATVNDAVLAAVAGALHGWIQHHHGHAESLRVKVPVSLHTPGDDAGNRDSFFTLALPLGEPDPVARLRAVRAATAARKAEHDAETLAALLRDLGRVSPRLQRFCEKLEAGPRTFAFNVSNVPGPADPVAVLGASVKALHSVAEIGERHALRIAVVSAAGRLNFGLCSDPSIVADLPLIGQGIDEEAAALVSAARVHRSAARDRLPTRITRSSDG